MAIVTLTSGKSFECSGEMSILDASVLGKISLPYSCKTGRCSTCKCRLVSGAARTLFYEYGLTDEEKALGWILSCVQTAETDLVLEFEYLSHLAELPPLKTWPCKIYEINKIASDVVRVYLKLPPISDFKYLPGQYINVIGPEDKRRSYSIANGLYVDQLLELHIKAVDGGAMTKYWFNYAKPGDLLRLSGPLGTFFLRDIDNVDLVFLATGTGIAPVKSMLESLANNKSGPIPKSVTVLWGGRRSQDLYLDVKNIPGEFTYIPVESRPEDSWTGARGHIQDVLIKAMPDLSNALIYACGSIAMIRNAKILLTSAGLPASKFHSDAFVSSGIN